MRKVITVLIFIQLLLNVSYPQDTNTIKFLPFKVGNIWVYRCSAFNSSPPCLCVKNIRIKISGTSVINGKTYFQSQITTFVYPSCYGSCNNTGPLPFDSLIRIDSFSGKVLRYSVVSGCVTTPNEILLDSLKAHLHDTIQTNCQPPVQWNTYICSDTSITTIFGLSRQSRSFSLVGFEGGWSRKYVKGIGVTNSSLSNLWCPNQTYLLGCVIDGVLFGDTTLITGVNKISYEIPEKFSLSQNYPNPFNPSTKIKFSIPLLRGVDGAAGRGVFTQLVVYDILGKEITTLVNQQLQPGTYEAEWDGSNYPSGVYFYKLITDEFTESRKMILIK